MPSGESPLVTHICFRSSVGNSSKSSGCICCCTSQLQESAHGGVLITLPFLLIPSMHIPCIGPLIVRPSCYRTPPAVFHRNTVPCLIVRSVERPFIYTMPLLCQVFHPWLLWIPMSCRSSLSSFDSLPHRTIMHAVV